MYHDLPYIRGQPFAALVEKKSSTGGRNNVGRITTRHRGGGHAQKYRIIDFKRQKDGIEAVVERLEYDPNRSAYIALVCYSDGERRYIIAARGMKAGDLIRNGDDAPIKNRKLFAPSVIFLFGSTVYCVELKPGRGAQFGS